jgi:hypothetical protein
MGFVVSVLPPCVTRDDGRHFGYSSAMSQHVPEMCGHCGAPRQPGLAACRYCKTPFVRNVGRDAIACPACGALNERQNAQKCASCSTWLVVQCIFCSALSPYDQPACVKCREPFAGAPERFAQKQQERQAQQTMQVVGAVGGVAASLLGAVASSMAHSHYQPSRRTSSGDSGFRSSSDDDPPSSDRGSGGGFLDELLRDTDPSDDGG